MNAPALLTAEQIAEIRAKLACWKHFNTPIDHVSRALLRHIEALEQRDDKPCVECGRPASEHKLADACERYRKPLPAPYKAGEK